MSDDHAKNEDQRPDVAKDDDTSIRKEMKEHWHQAEETLSEAPAGSPHPTKQSRTS